MDDSGNVFIFDVPILGNVAPPVVPAPVKSEACTDVLSELGGE
jgi:hypothetical protein